VSGREVLGCVGLDCWFGDRTYQSVKLLLIASAALGGVVGDKEHALTSGAKLCESFGNAVNQGISLFQ
jgi:hypothetical protein